LGWVSGEVAGRDACLTIFLAGLSGRVAVDARDIWLLLRRGC